MNFNRLYNVIIKEEHDIHAISKELQRLQNRVRQAIKLKRHDQQTEEYVRQELRNYQEFLIHHKEAIGSDNFLRNLRNTFNDAHFLQV